MEPWSRPESTASSRLAKGELTSRQVVDVPNEHDRWHRIAEQVEAKLFDQASVIHVMDTEADDYDLLQRLESHPSKTPCSRSLGSADTSNATADLGGKRSRAATSGSSTASKATSWPRDVVNHEPRGP